MDKAIKDSVVKRANNKCEFCGDKITEIHHTTYVLNDKETQDHLVAVCHRCHDLCHGLRQETLQGKALEIHVSNPKDIVLEFLNKCKEITVRVDILRVDIPKLDFILCDYIHYHPFAEGGFGMFKSKIGKDLARIGALCGSIRSYDESDDNYGIVSYQITSIKDSKIR
mgnify:CR=1 FL=1